MAAVPVVNFFVEKRTEFRIKERLVAVYLPEFDYRITNKNQEFVSSLLDKGQAHLGSRSQSALQVGGSLSGNVSLQKKG